MTVTREDIVAQRLTIRLLTFLGEWFANTAYGVPYWQRILGKKVDKSTVDAIFQEKILEEDGVAEILSFNSELSRTREYSLRFKVRCTDSTIANVAFEVGV
jgi:hypothetical protein